VQETTALGAAYAAGLAVGFYPGIDALRENWKADRVWNSQMEQASGINCIEDGRKPSRDRLTGQTIKTRRIDEPSWLGEFLVP